MICPIMSRVIQNEYLNSYNQSYKEASLHEVECIKERCAMWKSRSIYSEKYDRNGRIVAVIREADIEVCGMKNE